MVRRGGAIQKKTSARRGRPWPKEDVAGDEDDEEYVLENDGGSSESSEESFASSDSESGDPTEFESEELEIEVERPRSKRRKAPAAAARRRRGPRAPPKRKRRARVSDDDDGEDEDFDPDEEEEPSPIWRPCAKRRGLKPSQGSRALKKTAKAKTKSYVKPSEKREVEKSVAVDASDDFIEKDRVELEKKRRPVCRKRKRSDGDSDFSDSDYEVSEEEEEVKKRPRGRPKKKNVEKKKRSAHMDSESEFSDFVVSEEEEEEEEEEEQVRRRGPPRKKKKKKKQKTEKGKSLRSVDSESDFSEFVVSEEELRDLRIGGVANWPQQQPKRIFPGREEEKAKEKGKEKAVEDNGRQVCGICLSEEKKNIVRGVLNCCVHYFCFVCIMEWSKVESRCPVCKQRFESISKSGGSSNTGFGIRRTVIRVPKRDQVYQPSEEEMRGFLDPYEHVVCMECQQGGDDYLMLLCDICDSPAHTYCVGLGREVPDGNWYCEGCRPARDGSSYPQVTGADGVSSSDLISISATGIDNYTNMRSSTQPSVSSQGQSPLIGIDLNMSPRYPWNDENESAPLTSGPPRCPFRQDHEPASRVSGTGASTLSGRRAIHQRIRILFHRTRQLLARRLDVADNQLPSVVEPEEETAHQSEDPFPPNSLHTVSASRQGQQNGNSHVRWNVQSYSGFSNGGSSSRTIEDVKVKVRSMVKSQMKSLSRNIPLERSSLKVIARRSTHTILAACGVEHRRELVATSVLPPNSCSHEDESANLIKGCCSACFTAFVGSVVEKLMKEC